MLVGFAKWLQATPLSIAVQSARWVVPAMQVIHLIALSIVFISALMVILRALGRMRTDEPFAETWRQFSRYIRRGVVVLLISGAVLTIAEPIREFTSTSFWTKMVLILVALAATRAVGMRYRDNGGDRSGAVFALVVWVAIIFFGRAIAYDEQVWSVLTLLAAR
jgi:putative copper export protein